MRATEVLFATILLFMIFDPILLFAEGPHEAPKIESLTQEVQGKGPEAVRELIVRRFGPPARDIGSGIQIEQWDVDGGILTFHPHQGLTFQKGGVATRLIRTTNPAELCLFGSYEMDTGPEGHSAMFYYLGDVSLSAGHYRFTDSGSNLDHRNKQQNNFFMMHPDGLVKVKYASGVSAKTRLEDLSDGSPVATVTFSAANKRFSATYRIVANRSSMSLALQGKGIPFQLTKGWVNYWR
ncbi:MAG TPA: hypothetical protein VF532_04845 [Candidatus Angelobacter sp.]